MKLKGIMLGLFAILFICNQGYCLFRDDVGSQQVQSAIKIQRVKDEQRKNQSEQVKSQSVINEDSGLDDKISSSQFEDKKAPHVNPAKLINRESAQRMPQYKRLTAQGTIIDTPQPGELQPAAILKKEEKKSAKGGLIFSILVLAAGGFIAFKQQKNKV